MNGYIEGKTKRQLTSYEKAANELYFILNRGTYSERQRKAIVRAITELHKASQQQP